MTARAMSMPHGSHYAAPTCVWRTGQDRPALASVQPGDNVHLCTATAVWTLTHTDADQATIRRSHDGFTMTVHRAHLDPADTGQLDGQLDGQRTIYDELETA